MVKQAVTSAWLISRQQTPSQDRQSPPLSAEEPPAHLQPSDELSADDEILDDVSSGINKTRPDMRRCRIAPVEPPQNDGFWTSHLFWKGIVLGVLLVVLIKTVLQVQTPFGIDWYDF